MNERFGRKDLPHIIWRQLQDLKQEQDELLEEYAEREQEMDVYLLCYLVTDQSDWYIFPKVLISQFSLK
jgi:hypothetical protein